MGVFRIQGCCSLTYSRFVALRSPLVSSTAKQPIVSAPRIQIASFTNDRRNESGNCVSASIHPTSRIKKVINDKIGSVRPRSNVNEMLGSTDVGLVISDSISRSPRSQSELRTHIDYIFADMNICNEVLFDEFIRVDLHECNVSNIGRFMRLGGKKSRSKSNDYLKKNLPTIASRLQALKSSSWMYMDISFVIYGLQNIGEKDAGYLDILTTMTEIAKITLKSKKILPPQDLSMMLYGLQKNTGCGDVNSQLLAVISQIAKQCSGTFKPQEMGNALYGLQGMSSDNAEVCALLSSLEPKIRSCKEALKAQHVGNALYGMQGMNSDNLEVRSVLSALVIKVRDSKEIFDAQAVSNSLYGMQNMSSQSKEVCDMLAVLAAKVRSCKEELDSQHVGNALYGMQKMSSDDSEVLTLLTALTPKIKFCEGIFDPQHISNAIFGMQGMSSDSDEVTALLSSLVPKVKACKKSFTAHEISSLLYGMKRMSSKDANVRALISSIAFKITSTKEGFSAIHITNVLYGLQEMKNDQSEVLALLAAVAPKIKSSKQSLNVYQIQKSLVGMQRMRKPITAPLIYSTLFTHINKLATYNITSMTNEEVVCLNESVTLILPVIKDCLKSDEYKKWEDINKVLDSNVSQRYNTSLLD